MRSGKKRNDACILAGKKSRALLTERIKIFVPDLLHCNRHDLRNQFLFPLFGICGCVALEQSSKSQKRFAGITDGREYLFEDIPYNP